MVPNSHYYLRCPTSYTRARPLSIPRQPPPPLPSWTVPLPPCHCHSPYKQCSLDEVLEKFNCASNKLNTMWGATSSATQFVTMGMFIQSFWFSARLVRDSKIGASDVVAVLLGMFDHNEQFTDVNSSLDLAKGKFAIVALLTLILDLQRPSPPTRLRHQALPLLPPTPWSPSAESHPNLPWQVPYRLCRSAPCLTLPPCSRTHFRRQLFWLWQIHHRTDPTQSILCR